MSKSSIPWVFRVVLSSLVVGAAVLGCVVVARHADQEALRPQATCHAVGCYCEAVQPIGVRQPVDAWSSLAPALGGAVVLAWSLGRRGGSALSSSRAPGVLLALAACSISVFSFHYHATLTWLGEWLDGVSLFLLAGFGIAWAIARRRSDGGLGFSLVYLGLAAVPAAISWWIPVVRKIAFLALVATAVTVELRWRRRQLTEAEGGWFVAALSCFGLALVAWMLDWYRVVCAPKAVYQLHALWHLLSAPTIILLYGYFRSERVRPDRLAVTS